MFAGYALLEKGEPAQARERLEPVVAELEGFGFPQWHALAATLLGESWRLLGRLDEADASVQCGLRTATRAGYWYAVGLSHRVAGRIARDRGAAAAASHEFQQALETFERIGAAVERARTRAELDNGREASERRS